MKQNNKETDKVKIVKMRAFVHIPTKKGGTLWAADYI